MIFCFIVLCVAVLLWAFSRIAAIGAGYKAKVLCSALFVSKRSLESALQDVSCDSYRFLKLLRVDVDEPHGRVTASFLGFCAKTAVHRSGLGATLVIGDPPAGLKPHILPPLKLAGDRPWPEGEPQETVRAVPERVARILDGVFPEPNCRRLRRTRAVVVVQDGRLVAERYAPGFGPHMPLPGWSMTKSVLHALVGILVGEGRLSLQARGLLPEWSDARRDISLDDLLRMRSGLKFSEVYGNPLSDVTRMLFDNADAGAFAADKKLVAVPGVRWAYSSGTSNIIARIVRRATGLGAEQFLEWPRRALFEPLGMASAVMEPDASGNLVPSSFMLATARDWARFGLLYAQDGVWAGRRILPEGWVTSGRTHAPQSHARYYGAHWWLKLSKEFGGHTPAAAHLPTDAFFALGHEGQVVAVIPSRRLVVVRLGLSIYEDAWNEAAFLAELLDVLA